MGVDNQKFSIPPFFSLLEMRLCKVEVFILCCGLSNVAVCSACSLCKIIRATVVMVTFPSRRAFHYFFVLFVLGYIRMMVIFGGIKIFEIIERRRYCSLYHV